jgi:hypothetical protein
VDYQKIYNNLIQKAISDNRLKGKTIYYEAHHIIPTCMGGTGTNKQWKTHSNIVLLTAKEHFIAQIGAHFAILRFGLALIRVESVYDFKFRPIVKQLRLLQLLLAAVLLNWPLPLSLIQ